MVAKGYTFTQHLQHDNTDSDGNLVYTAKMTTPEGYSMNMDLTVYKDKNSADAALIKDVATLKVMGFDGSYSDADSWTATMLYQGSSVAGGAVESSGGAPHMVTVFFMS